MFLLNNVIRTVKDSKRNPMRGNGGQKARKGGVKSTFRSTRFFKAFPKFGFTSKKKPNYYALSTFVLSRILDAHPDVQIIDRIFLEAHLKIGELPIKIIGNSLSRPIKSLYYQSASVGFIELIKSTGIEQLN
jgi:ribosomal protein L15